MPLYLVGAGVSSEYLTLRALQLIGRADKIYIESYTSIAPGIDEELVARLNPRAEVARATRSLLEEGSSRLIEEAREKTVVVLVPGDPLHATTHVALIVEAKRAGVEAEAVPGVSGVQAVIDATGLQFYRFGKPVTLIYPEPGLRPLSVVETIHGNMERGLHSLVLLDLRLDQGKAMTIPEAVKLLLELEEELAAETGAPRRLASSLMVGVARAGLPEQRCYAGSPGFVASRDYPPPPHSVVVAAPRLHPVEEEALQALCTAAELPAE